MRVAASIDSRDTPYTHSVYLYVLSTIQTHLVSPPSLNSRVSYCTYLVYSHVYSLWTCGSLIGAFGALLGRGRLGWGWSQQPCHHCWQRTWKHSEAFRHGYACIKFRWVTTWATSLVWVPTCSAPSQRAHARRPGSPVSFDISLISLDVEWLECTGNVCSNSSGLAWSPGGVALQILWFLKGWWLLLPLLRTPTTLCLQLAGMLLSCRKQNHRA